MSIGRGAKRPINIFATLLAFLTVMLFAFLYLNNVFDFGIAQNVLSILYVVREYMALATILLVGLEFAVTKNFVVLLLYCIVALGIVIFSLYPLFAQQVAGYLMQTI